MYTEARNAFVQVKASKTSSVAQPGLIPTPSDSPTHPLGLSATLAVQGTSQSGSNANPDQPATSVVTVSSQSQNVTLSASSAQANNFSSSTGSINPSGYTIAPSPQYPLLQPSTQQPTCLHWRLVKWITTICSASSW